MTPRKHDVVQVFSAAVLFATVSSEASACPYQIAAAAAAPGTPILVTVDIATATHCAKGEKLVGQNCSYTTGMVARRVVEEGQDWSWSGLIAEAHDNLASQVAAPYVAEPGTRVIANELVETLANSGHARAHLALVGKLLEVDGVRYVVLTSYRVERS